MPGIRHRATHRMRVIRTLINYERNLPDVAAFFLRVFLPIGRGPPILVRELQPP